MLETASWEGFKIDEMGGSSIARVQCIFVDQESREPAWVIAKVGRFGKSVAIPYSDCAAGAGHIWVPYTRDVLRGAPGIDPGKPLTREQELLICEHYDIPEELGRAAELADRTNGQITSRAEAAAA